VNAASASVSLRRAETITVGHSEALTNGFQCSGVRQVQACWCPARPDQTADGLDRGRHRIRALAVERIAAGYQLLQRFCRLVVYQCVRDLDLFSKMLLTVGSSIHAWHVEVNPTERL
jgi:hypothetical protein